MEIDDERAMQAYAAFTEGIARLAEEATLEHARKHSVYDIMTLIKHAAEGGAIFACVALYDQPEFLPLIVQGQDLTFMANMRASMKEARDVREDTAAYLRGGISALLAATEKGDEA